MNICMPKMAKTSWKASTTPSALETAGIVLISEMMMSFMPSWRARSLSGRRTRSTRSDFKLANGGKVPASSTRKEEVTIARSSKFHGSLT